MASPEPVENNEVEAELRKHHAGGDFRQVATLGLGRYGAEILRFAFAMMKQRVLAEEVFSEGCEKIWIGIPQFRFECSFRTWVFLIIRRLCIQHLRDPNHKRMRPLSDAGPLSAIIGEVRTQTAEYLRDETKDRLRVLREALTPEEQAILTLRLDRGLSWSEIAEVMNDAGGGDPDEMTRREASLRKQFERLKDRLRELAKREGLLKTT